MTVNLFGVSKLRMEATQARLSLHLLKCHIVGNHMSRLIYKNMILTRLAFVFKLINHSNLKILNLMIAEFDMF